MGVPQCHAGGAGEQERRLAGTPRCSAGTRVRRRDLSPGCAAQGAAGGLVVAAATGERCVNRRASAAASTRCALGCDTARPPDVRLAATRRVHPVCAWLRHGALKPRAVTAAGAAAWARRRAERRWAPPPHALRGAEGLLQSGQGAGQRVSATRSSRRERSFAGMRRSSELPGLGGGRAPGRGRGPFCRRAGRAPWQAFRAPSASSSGGASAQSSPGRRATAAAAWLSSAGAAGARRHAVATLHAPGGGGGGRRWRACGAFRSGSAGRGSTGTHG